MIVHLLEIPKWDKVLHRIDMCYVIEYAIAERNDSNDIAGRSHPLMT
jgi:hypothetical protein